MKHVQGIVQEKRIHTYTDQGRRHPPSPGCRSAELCWNLLWLKTKNHNVRALGSISCMTLGKILHLHGSAPILEQEENTSLLKKKIGEDNFINASWDSAPNVTGVINA